jgi:hypothetical protein
MIAMHSLFERCKLLARFPVLYHVYPQIQSPELTPQFEMIQEVIGPGLTNSSHRCHIGVLGVNHLSYPPAEAYDPGMAKL